VPLIIINIIVIVITKFIISDWGFPGEMHVLFPLAEGRSIDAHQTNTGRPQSGHSCGAEQKNHVISIGKRLPENTPEGTHFNKPRNVFLSCILFRPIF
jgi:hypothetical protein